MSKRVIIDVETVSTATKTTSGRHMTRLFVDMDVLSDALRHMQDAELGPGETSSQLLAKIIKNYMAGDLETVIHAISEAVEDGDDWPWSDEVSKAIAGLVLRLCSVAAMHPESASMNDAVMRIRSAVAG